MPPAGPPFEPEISPEDYPTLTDEDVAILYRIITSAERYSYADALPFRALFAAYDKVLAQNGIDPNHDQIYLRFLFRLGDNKRANSSLHQNFEALLAELGILVEIDEESVKSHEATETPVLGQQPLIETGIPTPLDTSSSRRRRSARGSLNYLYEDGNEGTRAILYRPRSRASMSQLQPTEKTLEVQRPSTRATTRTTEKTRAQSLQGRFDHMQPIRRRLTAQDYAPELQSNKGRRAPTQPDTQGPIAEGAEGEAYDQVDDAIVSSIRNTFQNEAQRAEQGLDSPQAAYAVDQLALFYRPSETQLLRDVDTFAYYRIQHVVHGILEKWSRSAFRANKKHESMVTRATKYDTRELLRQGFDHWRMRCQQRRNIAAIEEYFGHQERRVGKVRDHYLLSKAFSHWVECTHEERLRVFQARQKVLRSKYFSAWLELTIINVLKVRRLQLLKSFKIWQSRAGRIYSQKTQAVFHSKLGMVRSVYWRWFWTFCENRAPEWRTTRLKKRIFLLWGYRQRQILNWEQHLSHERSLEITRKHFLIWRAKARSTREILQAAISFDMKTTYERTLSIWRRKTRQAPLIRDISRMVDWRVAGSTFAMVVLRYRRERQADLVKQLRIMRNAWTNWNDLLRIRILAKSIDDRILIEALYRWVLLQRYVLLYRLYQERITKSVFSEWRNRWYTARRNRDLAVTACEAAANRSRVRSIIKHWRSRKELRCQDQILAFEFSAPKIVGYALHLWKAKTHHVQKLHVWARDAQFYFLATRLIKKHWKNAMIESKRQKRRIAYGQLRRITKVHLAKGVLYLWDLRARAIQDSKREARLHDEQRLLRFGADLFDNWKERTLIVTTQRNQAEEHYTSHLLNQHFRVWSDELRAQTWKANLALVHDNMRISDIALSCLHQLRLRMINLRGREPNALSLRKYHERRQSYTYFRAWQEKTAKRLHHPMRGHTPAFDVAQQGGIVAARRSEYDAARPEEWSIDRGEFNLSEWIPALEAHVDGMSLPGYPSTPSKRAARAKAVVEASTTPAGTPFQFRLRSQLATEPRSARPDKVTRSGFLRDSIFATVLEVPPRTPKS